MPLRYHNASEVPLALAVFLASDYYDYNDDPNVISTTTLLKPTRQIILAKRLPKVNNLEDLIGKMSNRIGAAVHDGIERAWLHNYHIAMDSLGYPASVIARIRINPTDEELLSDPKIIPIYLEQRMEKKLGKWLITGKFDFIGEGRVQDFKTTKIWSYMNQVNADKQILQGSIYRWLDPKKIKRDQMDIHHIFTDWKPAEAKINPKYPQKPFQKQTFNLMNIQETEKYILNKLGELDNLTNADESDLPECDDDALWRSDPQFKWYKNGIANSKRATKNFETMHDAIKHRATEGNGMGEIKEVPGTVKACGYCPAYSICTQKDRLIIAGQLIG
jgi:hypothetical protein